jgi:hypothetical protein
MWSFSGYCILNLWNAKSAEPSPQRGELEGGEDVCLELFPNAVLSPLTNTSHTCACVDGGTKAWYDEHTMKKPATLSLSMMMRSAEVMSLGYGALGRE